MIFDTNQEAPEAPEAPEAEGGDDSAETVSISKKEWEKSQQTIGSLKRELKDLRKPKEDTKETAQETKSDDSALLKKMERMALKGAGITHPDDVELARKTAKKWGVDLDEVLDDEDFQAKLEKGRAKRANEDATSNVRGDRTGASAKDTVDYWKAKGTPPTPSEVPDRKKRQTIIRAMMTSSKNGGGQFYNS